LWRLSRGGGPTWPNHPVQILPQLVGFWALWSFKFATKSRSSLKAEGFMAKANLKSGLNVFKICN
jgi:hypothetical protein